MRNTAAIIGVTLVLALVAGLTLMLPGCVQSHYDSAQLKERFEELAVSHQFRVIELGRQVEINNLGLEIEVRANKLIIPYQELDEEEWETSSCSYYGLVEQQYGVTNLEDCLSRWYWKSYKINAFDCSEMSAALEWLLENKGFHTVIVSGEYPGNGEWQHSWLLVETSEGEYMPVEATSFSIIYPGDPYFEDYLKYEMRFETINEALEWAPEGYDWWK